jgi:hypothetical protein
MARDPKAIAKRKADAKTAFRMKRARRNLSEARQRKVEHDRATEPGIKRVKRAAKKAAKAVRKALRRREKADLSIRAGKAIRKRRKK